MTTIASITIENFKSIRNQTIRLGPINALVGANGSGKSNFFGAVRMVAALADGSFQRHMIRADGADRVLHFGRQRSRFLKLGLDLRHNGYPHSIEVVLAPTEGNRLLLDRAQGTFHGDIGSKTVALADRGGEELALSASPEAVVRHVASALRAIKVFHFHDTSPTAPLRQPSKRSDRYPLASDGGNLPSFLCWLRDRPGLAYRNLLRAIQVVAPFLDDFLLELDDPDSEFVTLKWRHRGSERVFDAYDLSDGTLRFIALAALFAQPAPPDIVLIDEPELGLHPHAIAVLVDLMRSPRSVPQVILATQSVTLVNHLLPDEVIVVDRKNEGSHFENLDPPALQGWLEDYSLGQVWEKNVFGGVAP